MAPALEASRLPEEQRAERLRSRNPYGTEARSTECPGAEGTCVLRGPMIPQQQALALVSTGCTRSAGELVDRRDEPRTVTPSRVSSRSRGVAGALRHVGERTEPEKPGNTPVRHFERRVFADTRLTAYRLAV